MNDREFLVHVLNILPKEYDMVFDGLQHWLLMSDSDELTIEDTKDKLRYCFLVTKGRSSKKTEEDNALLIKIIKNDLQNTNLVHEQALVDFSIFSKQFKEKCKSYYKYSHEAAECPDKNTNSDIAGGNPGRFQGKCFK